MGNFLLYLTLFLGGFVMVDGVVGVVTGHMWGFKQGGRGPIPIHGREARVVGVVYVALGFAFFWAADQLSTLIP